MYDLNAGGGGGTPLTYNPSIPDNGAGVGAGLTVPKPGNSKERDTGYDAQRTVIDRKNNDDKQQGNPMLTSMAFSTPISELEYEEPMNNMMSGDMHTVIPPQASVAPHEMLMAQPAQQAQQKPPSPEATTPVVVVEEKKYPLGLTKEQYEAVIVAILVALVFYPEVQAKLAIYIPNFMSKDGSRSMAGLAVSGLIVAVGFYLARRYFVDK